MPTVQFAEVPNKSSISNNCCVYAIMVVALSVLNLQPNFQKLCMAMDPFFYAIATKSINVILLPYFQCPIHLPKVLSGHLNITMYFSY